MQGGGAIVGSNGVFHPAKFGKGFSNFPMKRPFEEIQLVDKHSSTYSFSRPSRTGAATGMRAELAPAAACKVFMDGNT